MPSINAVPLEGNSQESSRSPTQNPIDRSRVLPSKRGFKLASLNINKLTTHLDELKIFLVSNDIDVLAINETKLNEYITDNEVSISGYDIVRRDRTTYGGGGVCFYVKKSINFSVRNDLCMDSLENLCIEIRKPRSKSFIVATWYRPPNSLVGIFSPFEELIGKLDSLNTEFYLLGDLNCNMAASQFDSDTRKLLTITDVYGLQQLITEPTRITETSATLMDLIFTNCPDKVLCSGVRHIGISDHSMVYVYRKLAINGQSKGHTNITYRNFRSFDRDKFRSDVASQDWDHINNSSNPNDVWNEWKESFLAIVNKHAPLRTPLVRARGIIWGKGKLIIKTKLVLLSPNGSSSVQAPDSYKLRVSGILVGIAFSGQAIFNISGIKTQDVGSYTCELYKYHNKKSDHVKLILPSTD
ncbi:uncharacterized protein [Montipora foliosa]|uniref:uncharacterized protein n=1 Tax=Montipora foliosa TaxID=591990 RepID=UPI0035F1B486